MSPFPFLQKVNLPELARQLSLTSFVPEFELEGMRTGVDNLRVDVSLSPRFLDVTSAHINRLLARYANVEDFLVEDTFTKALGSVQAAPVSSRPNTTISTQVPPVGFGKKTSAEVVPAAAAVKPPTNPGYVGPAQPKQQVTTMFTPPGGVASPVKPGLGYVGPAEEKKKSVTLFQGGNISSPLEKIGASGPMMPKNTTAVNIPAGGFASPAPLAPAALKTTTTLKTPAAGWQPSTQGTKTAIDSGEFKRVLTDVLTVSLNKAKSESNIHLDLLARLAVMKVLRAEAGNQFNNLVEQCKARLKLFEGPNFSNQPKVLDMKNRFAAMQVSKRVILRKAGQDLFSTMREVEKESLAKLRRSLFGEQFGAQYEMFVNRLAFTEDGRDDNVNAEFYILLGSSENAADRYTEMRDYAMGYLQSLLLTPAGAKDEEQLLDGFLCAPENALELVGGGTPDESTAKGKSQKSLLDRWMEILEKASVMDSVLAMYETVPLIAQYGAILSPQQIKSALLNSAERKKVETLLLEHGKFSPEALIAAVKRLEGYRALDRAKFAGRFLSDLMRYHRDFRRMNVLVQAVDKINVVTQDRMRELSAINRSLYEFMMADETRPVEATIASHVILKADIRDSTSLTRTLFERGLNPASYFSLNFFDPVNKLLPKYNATKVFIEGDALILALFERQGMQECVVGRTCMLAKEMVQIVRAYNVKSTEQGLPRLELGLGICYQDSEPMYLMDEDKKIMISKALNESDRLSGCSKGARKFLGGGGGEDSLFNVFSFQTVDDKDAAGMPDEFLVRYNIGGVHINALAFEKLQKEISLKRHELELPMIWDKEKVILYTGMVPVAPGIVHKIVVREASIAWVDPHDFSLKQWTAKKYYEVCVNETIYEYMASEFTTVQ